MDDFLRFPSALLSAQEPAALERIGRAIADEARRYAAIGAVELPMRCLVTRGTKI